LIHSTPLLSENVVYVRLYIITSVSFSVLSFVIIATVRCNKTL